MFHFSTCRPSSLKDFSYLSANFWMLDAKNDASCCPCQWRTTDCTSVYDTNFCPPSIFTPNVNSLLRKALVVIYWMHFRVDLICIYFLFTKNTITTCCLLREDFRVNVAIFDVYKWCHSDIIVMKLTAATQN